MVPPVNCQVPFTWLDHCVTKLPHFGRILTPGPNVDNHKMLLNKDLRFLWCFSGNGLRFAQWRSNHRNSLLTSKECP